jgi:hypothetical protein
VQAYYFVGFLMGKGGGGLIGVQSDGKVKAFCTER